MSKKLGIIAIFVLLFMLCPAYAAPPQSSVTYTSQPNLQIQYVDQPYVKSNASYEFNFHVFNSTSGTLMTNATTSCRFDLYGIGGTHLYVVTTPIWAENSDFEISVPASNFTTIGTYSYIFQCNTSTYGGFTGNSFEVNAVGGAFTSTTALLVGIVVIVLLSIAGIFGVLAFKLDDEHYALKFSSLILMLFFIIMSFQFILVSVKEYIGGSLFELMEDFWFVFMMIFIVLISYLLIYLTKKAMESLKLKQQGLDDNEI